MIVIPAIIKHVVDTSAQADSLDSNMPRTTLLAATLTLETSGAPQGIADVQEILKLAGKRVRIIIDATLAE